VQIGCDNGDGARLAGGDLGLRDRQRVYEAKTGAADVECATGFTRADARVKLGGERRIKMMRFAGGDDRVDLVRRAGGGLKSFVDGLCAEGDFGFVLGSVGERFDSGAAAELADGHAEGAIDFFGRDDAGTEG
jgi:hypothetical protein